MTKGCQDNKHNIFEMTKKKKNELWEIKKKKKCSVLPEFSLDLGKTSVLCHALVNSNIYIIL